ncbi:hypothetical protein apy_03810 [Aeropyrum pernix]|uniref:Membrane-bound metal-dependent hydrolase n=1 Tax=Aeropyrum pernix TaxID=56636 RepID=A0A401H859_AERPX|nr:hypothetical protein [Aeropyrum pernix]GBF08656.1 hypothetical protein apy_03810 [Aeropyrum pernix]
MKTETHIVFGLGVAVLAAAAAAEIGLGRSCLVPLVLASAGIHVAIDSLSHETVQAFSLRTRMLHSVETLTPLSVAAGLVAGYVAGGSLECELGGAAVFLASGLSHLFLDALNPTGVWLLGRRVSIPMGRWDDPVLNGVFSIAGFSLALIGVLIVLG